LLFDLIFSTYYLKSFLYQDFYAGYIWRIARFIFYFTFYFYHECHLHFDAYRFSFLITNILATPSASIDIPCADSPATVGHSGKILCTYFTLASAFCHADSFYCFLRKCRNENSIAIADKAGEWKAIRERVLQEVKSKNNRACLSTSFKVHHKAKASSGVSRKRLSA
jgi:hypothetical protein